MIPGPDYLAWLIILNLHYLVFVLNFLKSKGLNQTFYFLNFQGFTYCLIFNYQGSLLLTFFRSNFDIISWVFSFVNNFFNLFFFLFFCLATAKYILPDVQHNVNNFFNISPKSFSIYFHAIKGRHQAPLYTIYSWLMCLKRCNPV